MLSVGGTTRPVNDEWLSRMEANTSRGNQMPYGRAQRGNSRSHRNGSDSARSASSLSDRELLAPVYMINDGQTTYGTPREGTVLNVSPTWQNPAIGLEYPPELTLETHPITREEHDAYNATWASLRKSDWVLEQRRRRNEVGANIVRVPGVPPCIGDASVALATNPATLVAGENTILMDIGSNVNIIGILTAQNFERTAARHGHAVRKSDIKPALFISGVGSGAAACDERGVFPIGVQYKRTPDAAGNPAKAGHPAIKLPNKKTYENSDNPDLENFIAAIATGSGEGLPAIMGRRQMSEENGLLILTKGQEKFILLGDASYKIMLGPGARVVDLKSAPSGHLVMKVDDFTNSKVKTEQKAYTLHASKDEPHLLEEHDESNAKMEDALTRDRARAHWPWPWDEKLTADTYKPNREERRAIAANAAGSSDDHIREAPAANAATNTTNITPPPSWFDPEQREKMVNSHMCMMSMDHGHLDYTFEEYGSKDEGDLFNLYMKNIVDSFLNAWFHERGPVGRAAYGLPLPTPTEGETERCTRHIQSKVYQHIQAEIDRQKDQRWPNRFDENLGRQRDNLPERFDIHSD